MNIYVKNFLQRGIAFGGFGPVVAGIVFLILSYTIENFSLTGTETFIAIISTYLLAFVQAGASIFNQIERWPVAKSLVFHSLTLYVAYVTCYLVNARIPFEPVMLVIFSVIFFAVYFIIWLTVFITTRAVSKKMNSAVNRQ